MKLYNFCLVHLQVLLRREVVKGFPISVQIEPTNVCQLQCPTCPTGLGINPDPRGKMRQDDFKKIIDELKDYLYEILLFGFGEPLLHKDIYEMIKYATENNIRTALSSNLCNLQKGDIDRIIDSGLELLVVSLDGITQETYKRYRVKGDVQQVKRNVETLIQRKKELGRSNPVIQIQFIVMDHNRHEITKAIEYSRRINVEEFILKDVGPRYIPRVFKNENTLERTRHLRKELNMCHKLWTESYIGWNGSIRPCCLTFDGTMGNVLSERFDHIWNNNKYILSRRIFRHRIDLVPDLRVPCLSCHLLSDR
ncbi:MAG: radical SAM protein [Thermoplasmata archaeon]|nr:MAG: radical SAM protein [Thermoplasmata archaeon]